MQQPRIHYFPLVAGQSVDLINNLPTAAEVMESLIREAGPFCRRGLPEIYRWLMGLDERHNSKLWVR